MAWNAFAYCTGLKIIGSVMIIVVLAIIGVTYYALVITAYGPQLLAGGKGAVLAFFVLLVFHTLVSRRPHDPSKYFLSARKFHTMVPFLLRPRPDSCHPSSTRACDVAKTFPSPSSRHLSSQCSSGPTSQSSARTRGVFLQTGSQPPRRMRWRPPPSTSKARKG